MVEKSSPSRSGAASYRSFRHASVPENERGSSVVAIALRILGSAGLPERLVAGIRGASQDEEQVGEPVEVDRDERVRLRHCERPPLGAATDRAGQEQPRGELASTREDEALQRLEVGVSLVA